MEVKCYGDLLKDIRDQVNQKIYNIVNDDINNLNLSKEELELLREKTITDSFLDKCKTNAKEHILESSKEHFYIEYADYEIEIEQYKRYVVYFDYIKLICFLIVYSNFHCRSVWAQPFIDTIIC